VGFSGRGGGGFSVCSNQPGADGRKTAGGRGHSIPTPALGGTPARGGCRAPLGGGGGGFEDLAFPIPAGAAPRRQTAGGTPPAGGGNGHNDRDGFLGGRAASGGLLDRASGVGQRGAPCGHQRSSRLTSRPGMDRARPRNSQHWGGNGGGGQPGGGGADFYPWASVGGRGGTRAFWAPLGRNARGRTVKKPSPGFPKVGRGGGGRGSGKKKSQNGGVPGHGPLGPPGGTPGWRQKVDCASPCGQGARPPPSAGGEGEGGGWGDWRAPPFPGGQGDQAEAAWGENGPTVCGLQGLEAGAPGKGRTGATDRHNIASFGKGRWGGGGSFLEKGDGGDERRAGRQNSNWNSPSTHPPTGSCTHRGP